MEIVLGNLMIGIAQILGSLLNILMILVIIDAVLSWVNPDPNNPIVRFLRAATEPIMTQVRRRIRTTFGPLDLAPIIVLFTIILLQSVVVGSLNDFGMKFRASGASLPQFDSGYPGV